MLCWVSTSIYLSWHNLPIPYASPITLLPNHTTPYQPTLLLFLPFLLNHHLILILHP